MKTQTLTLTTNGAGNVSLGNDWLITKRKIVEILHNRADSDYETGLAIVSLCAGSSSNVPMLHIAQADGTAYANTEFKITIAYI